MEHKNPPPSTEPAATSDPLAAKLQSLRLLLLDVDGVMTDGLLYYHPDGSESKAFHVRDGLGIRLAMEAGLQVGVITGRTSIALRRRCQDLKINTLYEAILDKAALVPEIMNRFGISAQHIGFVGDDIIDLPLLRIVGFSAAPADAHRLVRETVDWVAESKGGEGVVREVIEKVLQAKGLWQWALGWFEQKRGAP